MKENNLENIDLSFLSPKLKRKVILILKEGLKELEKIKWPIEAVVLGGGFKDGEVVYSEEKLISDIDLYLFPNFIPFFWKKLKKIEEKINKESSISFHFHGVIPLFLSKSRTYWAYRVKTQGIVLKGNKRILNKIKAKENNISEIEAIRILFWNLILWLNKNSNFYRILRSYLNLGESYLTFAKKLAPSFRERLKKLKEVAEEFKIDSDLLEKIKLGYKTRINSLKGEWGGDLSLEKARNDCLKAINQLLSIYLKTNLPLEKKMDLLETQIPPHYLLNFFFYFSLKKNKEIKPKFFQILFRFKITDLWKMIIYNVREEKKGLNLILNRYFSLKEFSEKILMKIYQSYPLFSFKEIL